MAEAYTDFYYIVSVNNPCRVGSFEEAQKTIDRVHPSNKGSFKCVRNCPAQRVGVYVYHYSSSLPASGAKMSEIYVIKRSVKTEDILPPEVVNCVFMIEQFQFVELSEVSAAVKAGIETALGIVENGLKTSGMEYLNELGSAGYCDTIVKKARVTPTVVQMYPEVAQNQWILEKLTESLQNLEFKVVGDRGAITSAHNSPLSIYCNSRPDIVIYHSKRLVAAVINSDIDSEEEDLALIGAVTENKKNMDGAGDVMGQLLAGMDKVAGELVDKHFHETDDLEDLLFNKIIIYGLIVYFHETKCSVHRLTMNFKDGKSLLENGITFVSMADGFNRLITQLQKTLR